MGWGVKLTRSLWQEICALDKKKHSEIGRIFSTHVTLCSADSSSHFSQCSCTVNGFSGVPSWINFIWKEHLALVTATVVCYYPQQWIEVCLYGEFTKILMREPAVFWTSMEICLYCIFNPAQSVNCMLGWMQSGTFNHARNLSASFSSTSLPYRTITGTRRSVSYMLWCCSDLWPRWIKLCIICEFSSSWTQPCGGNGISRSGEMICKKVVYIALKWPVPRRELPYVAIWKSWEMMPSDIKASVCAFVRCVVV